MKFAFIENLNFLQLKRTTSNNHDILSVTNEDHSGQEYPGFLIKSASSYTYFTVKDINTDQ